MNSIGWRHDSKNYKTSIKSQLYSQTYQKGHRKFTKLKITWNSPNWISKRWTATLHSPPVGPTASNNPKTSATRPDSELLCRSPPPIVVVTPDSGDFYRSPPRVSVVRLSTHPLPSSVRLATINFPILAVVVVVGMGHFSQFSIFYFFTFHDILIFQPFSWIFRKKCLSLTQISIAHNKQLLLKTDKS